MGGRGRQDTQRNLASKQATINAWKRMEERRTASRQGLRNSQRPHRPSEVLHRIARDRYTGVEYEEYRKRMPDPDPGRVRGLETATSRNRFASTLRKRHPRFNELMYGGQTPKPNYGSRPELKLKPPVSKLHGEQTDFEVMAATNYRRDRLAADARDDMDLFTDGIHLPRMDRSQQAPPLRYEQIITDRQNLTLVPGTQRQSMEGDEISLRRSRRRYTEDAREAPQRRSSLPVPHLRNQVPEHTVAAAMTRQHRQTQYQRMSTNGRERQMPLPEPSDFAERRMPIADQVAAAVGGTAFAQASRPRIPIDELKRSHHDSRLATAASEVRQVDRQGIQVSDRVHAQAATRRSLEEDALRERSAQRSVKSDMVRHAAADRYQVVRLASRDRAERARTHRNLAATNDIRGELVDHIPLVLRPYTKQVTDRVGETSHVGDRRRAQDLGRREVGGTLARQTDVVGLKSAVQPSQARAEMLARGTFGVEKESALVAAEVKRAVKQGGLNDHRQRVSLAAAPKRRADLNALGARMPQAPVPSDAEHAARLDARIVTVPAPMPAIAPSAARPAGLAPHLARHLKMINDEVLERSAGAEEQSRANNARMLRDLGRGDRRGLSTAAYGMDQRRSRQSQNTAEPPSKKLERAPRAQIVVHPPRLLRTHAEREQIVRQAAS